LPALQEAERGQILFFRIKISETASFRNNNFTNQKSLGLIAQEVEKVYPELVTTSNGSKAVQYGNLIAPLIEAIKAQQAQITALEARIRSLEKGN